MNKLIIAIGVIFLLLLGVSYFINVTVDQGTNFMTNSSLLGIIIFYNPLILGIYVAAGAIFILAGISWKGKTDKNSNKRK